MWRVTDQQERQREALEEAKREGAEAIAKVEKKAAEARKKEEKERNEAEVCIQVGKAPQYDAAVIAKFSMQ